MGTRLIVNAAVVAVAAALFVVPVRAHHAFTAEFDADKPVTLKGQVSKVEWINPHSWLYVDVKDPETGTVANWKIEMGAPNQLLLLHGAGHGNLTPAQSRQAYDAVRAFLTKLGIIK